ncbi:MAG: ATP-binding protein [Saprospiraceae bacterium]
MSPKKIIITSILLLYAFCSYTQEYLFDVQTINVEDGLPQRDVHSIMQDSEGYIWLSSQGTISRFDGHQFKNYDYNFLNVRANSGLLLALDDGDRLWYSEGNQSALNTFGGILDSKLDTVYTFESFSNGLIHSDNIAFIQPSYATKNNIIIGTIDGNIYKYDGEFHHIYKDSNDDLIWKCFEVEKDVFYLHYYINKHKDKQALGKIVNKKIVKKTVFQTPIQDIIKIKNRFFVQTFFDKRMYYDLSTNKQDLEIQLKSGLDIKGVFQIQENWICVNTKNGIVIQDNYGNILWRYFEYNQSGEGSQLKYSCVFKDVQGILWIGTADGIIKIQIKENPFTILQKNNSIRGITEIDNKQYIGGYFGNYRADLNNDNWTEFLSKKITVVGYLEDENDIIWMGTSVRIMCKYNRRTNAFDVLHLYNAGQISFPFINKVTNNFLLGTSEGIFYYDKIKNKVKKLKLSDKNINIGTRAIYTNEDGIWVVTTKGLFLLNPKTEKVIYHFSKKDGFPTNNFNHLYKDKKGLFWLGTKDKGLIRWNRKTNEIRQFSKKDGLSNNNIYAVYEDDFGGLWLPSDYGLMRFDKASFETKVYMPNDGIAHEEFNTFAHYQDKKGYLYFGGLKGVTKFHPKDFIEKKEFQPDLKISKIQVLPNNHEFHIDKTNEFLTQNKIILKHSDRILELQFALLDFTNPSENKYAYKILNYNNQWIYLNDNILSINNLPQGNYTLIIKARSAGGNWLDKELNLKIYVAPPFYFTWWFIFVVVLLIGLTIWWYFIYRTIQLQRQNLELEKIVKERTQKIEKQADELKALDKAKTQFFSNITHEFRTPLTLIIGPLQQLLKQTKEKPKQRKINTALNNANQLLGLVNQLLDISKLEHNKMRLEISFGGIVEFTENIVQRFQPLANQQQKKLVVNISTTSNQTYFDKEKWNKILSNLLSNALKYTAENGRIAVNLIVNDRQKLIKLIVKDNGIGIEKANLPLIFERFYQTNVNRDGQLGTGIGLALVKELIEVQNGSIKVESKVGFGTTFFVTLPIVETAIEPQSDNEKEPVLQAIPTVTESTILQKEKLINNDKTNLLIIEDNPEMRLYIRDCIDESIYEITEAKNGEEGVEKALKIIPDLIISDVMMPKKDGYEVTQTIRQTVSTSHIPLILLTAKASLESRLEGLQRGADVYLTKPFSAEELALRIKKLLEIRALIQQQFANQKLITISDNVQKTYKEENQFIIDVRKYILNNITNEKLTVESIGQAFAMSRMQFYRKIKALTNQSTSEFIRSIRLAKATELIKTQDLTLSEIAYDTGFTSLSSFSKAFKKRYGKSPSSL